MPNYDALEYEEPSRKALLSTLAQLQDRHTSLTAQGRFGAAALVKRSIRAIERKLEGQQDSSSNDEQDESDNSEDKPKNTSEALDMMGQLSRKSLSKSILLRKRNGKVR